MGTFATEQMLVLNGKPTGTVQCAEAGINIKKKTVTSRRWEILTFSLLESKVLVSAIRYSINRIQIITFSLVHYVTIAMDKLQCPSTSQKMHFTTTL